MNSATSSLPAAQVAAANCPPLPASLPASLEDSAVAGLPPTAFYIADFLTEDEEQLILSRVSSAPIPRWKQLTHRRLQTWPSDLVKDTLLDAQLPPWLETPIVPRLLFIPLTRNDPARTLFSDSPHQRPNHVLINEYPPGVGIMPHKDGAAYHPVVCTVSLGASLCLNIYRSKDDGSLERDPAWRILQEPRSLLITTQDLYTDYLHGIAEVDEDVDLGEETVANWSLLRDPTAFGDGRNQRQVRTSLTFRDVIKVSKLGSKLGMFTKR